MNDHADISSAASYFSGDSERSFIESAMKLKPIELVISNIQFVSSSADFNSDYINDMGYNFPHERYISKPIIIAKLGSDYHVLDGQHRLNYHANRGSKHISAIIVDGSPYKTTLEKRKAQLGQWVLNDTSRQ